MEHIIVGGEVSEFGAPAVEELIEQMRRDLHCGLREEVAHDAQLLLNRGCSAERILRDGLVEGMRDVAHDLRDGVMRMPEVLLAADAMEAGMEIVRPALAGSLESDGLAEISLSSWAVWPREFTTAIRTSMNARK